MCQIVVNDVSNPSTTFEPIFFDLSQYDAPVTFVASDNTSQVSLDLMNIFANMTRSSGSDTRVAPDGNLTAAVLDYGDLNIGDYRAHAVLAGEFLPSRFPGDDSLDGLFPPDLFPGFPLEQTQLVGVYNSVPNHARPTVRNLISNTLLEYLDDKGEEEEHWIGTTYWPLPLEKFVSP